MKQLSIISLLLIFLCACAHGNPSRRMVKKCTPILEEILEIQDLREELNEGIAMLILDYKSGLIDQSDYQPQFEEWLRHEGALRAYVTTLYDRAYEMRCL